MYLIGYLQINQLVMACSGIELGIAEAAMSIAFPPPTVYCNVSRVILARTKAYTPELTGHGTLQY